MIYSQTPIHNGPVRVSIKADGDGATLTLLDTQWSVVLSGLSLYLQPLHLCSCPLCTPTEMHSRKFLQLLLLLSFSNITHSLKIPN